MSFTLEEKKAIVKVLNNIEIIEENGGEDGYALAEQNQKNYDALAAVGVKKETIDEYASDGCFCVLSLAFSENIANHIENGKLKAVENIVTTDIQTKNGLAQMGILKDEDKTKMFYMDASVCVSKELSKDEINALKDMLS